MVLPIRIVGFGGVAPKIGAESLPDHMGQEATNCRLFSGDIEPWKKAKHIADASKGEGVKSIFRMKKADNSDLWLNWKTDVDVVPSPVSGDTSQRIYYTGDGEPRVTDVNLADGGDPPNNCYVLGVHPPRTAPTVSHSGGSGASISRSFVYTYVTEWGEESKPSPPSAVVQGKVDGTWSISDMDGVWPNSVSVSDGSWGGGVATLTVSSTFGFRVGETINVIEVFPPEYNVNGAKITAVTDTTISYELGINPGAYSSGGTVARVAPHHTNELRKRIYWSETSGGETLYQFVKEVSADTTSTTVAGNEPVGEPIPSTDYDMPPADMIGLMELPNGMIAGFSRNEVCFCEPFVPHAWPVKYRFSVFGTIVGIGAVDGSVVVCTVGAPSIITGTSPDAMSQITLSKSWPCLSKRGVVSMRDGVMFPSKEGIILISAKGSGVATADVLTSREFELFHPDKIFAAAYEERYFAWYKDGEVTRGFVFDRTGQSQTITNLLWDADGVWIDNVNGDMYLVNKGKIYLWDGGETYQPYLWKSKKFVLPSPSNYGAAKVLAKYEDLGIFEPPLQEDNDEYKFNKSIFDQPDVPFTISGSRGCLNGVPINYLDLNDNLATVYLATSKTKGCINDSVINHFELNGSLLKHGARKAGESETLESFLLFKLIADKREVFQKYLTDSRPFRLPTGYRASELEVVFEGTIRVNRCEIAGSMAGLSQV